MRNQNLNKIAEHVGTQYGDLQGVISIDGHSNVTSIYELCDDYKIDTTNKFIVGIGVTLGELRSFTSPSKFHVEIFYVDKNEHGSSYDEIQSKISNDTKLIIKKCGVEVEASTIGKYIKRINFLATTLIIDNIDNFEIEEEE
jgi:hypothetical protein